MGRREDTASKGPCQRRGWGTSPGLPEEALVSHEWQAAEGGGSEGRRGCP